MYKRLFITLLSTVVFAGCEMNPVTGKRELSLVSTQQELAIGTQQYKSSQQSQGGRYMIAPELNTYIDSVGQTLAKLSDRPELPYEFVVLNNDVPNAWALPGGKIAINRGLLVLLEDEAQLAAVLGHEIVHAAARHGANQLSRNSLLQFGVDIISQTSDNNLYGTLAGLGASAVNARYGRDDELEADFYGINYMVKAGYDPQAAVELQQTFLKLSQKGGQGGWLDGLLASHPPSAERVNKNQQRAKQLPKGKRNKAAYQNAIRQLKNDQPAYQLHANALKVAKKKDWAKAQTLTSLAIKQQSNEARFHITLGRLLNETKDYHGAIQSYNRAEKLEPSYFAPFFYRGLSHQQNQQYKAAQKDLIASNRLLETGIANYYLGEIALINNQRSSAINYYRKASQTGGNVGKAAVEKLKTLGVQ
ncbi:peptidase M48 [Candidatus Endobugula sertula]|uniref:Peptidase M48 n=1 Tax=Candidatus Endobugula sertula TaxID=62101 RepID=A0A1D2QR24_9GAMM|nr:peptidase M48 [Candidatus Endobugula sertula]